MKKNEKIQQYVKKKYKKVRFLKKANKIQHEKVCNFRITGNLWQKVLQLFTNKFYF